MAKIREKLLFLFETADVVVVVVDVLAVDSTAVVVAAGFNAAAAAAASIDDDDDDDGSGGNAVAGREASIITIGSVRIVSTGERMIRFAVDTAAIDSDTDVSWEEIDFDVAFAASSVGCVVGEVAISITGTSITASITFPLVLSGLLLGWMSGMTTTMTTNTLGGERFCG